MRPPTASTHLIAALLVLVAHAQTLRATLCSVDVVPAATLLFPVVEVDTACSSGPMTLIAISNTEPGPAVGHVTWWSDWSIPVLNFDIYLTGYDVQTLNLRDILCDGSLPQTGSAVSNLGSSSDPGLIANCNDTSTPGDPPVYDSPAIPQILRNHLQAWLTGQESPSSADCAGDDHGDSIARGYVTVDVVDECNFLFPTDAGYFGDGGVASDANVLTGDWQILDTTAATSLGPVPAVHLEADVDRTVFVPGDHTFYGRYVSADASDRREPLPSVWSLRDMGASGFNTDIVAWREGVGKPDTVVCGGTPVGLPLPNVATTFFDEQENPVEGTLALDLETTRVDLDAASPFGFGFARLDLGHDGVLGLYGDDRAQAWVAGIQTFSTYGPGLFQGTALDSNCSGTLVANQVFADGFESGGTSSWN